MYKHYELHEHHGVKYPFKARPYDDAEYYYARSTDGKSWRICYKGRFHMNFEGTFEGVVDILEHLNKNIKPIMCHN